MLAIGCDHGGYELKNEIIKYLDKKGIKYLDCGTFSKEAVDYPEYAKVVCNEILKGNCDKGILICGTGIGISITANRFKGIRAALCGDCFSAAATREHNDANVLCIGANFTKKKKAIKMIKLFLTTAFEGGRHARRLKKISGDK